jgi:hypothetical protein
LQNNLLISSNEGAAFVPEYDFVLLVLWQTRLEKLHKQISIFVAFQTTKSIKGKMYETSELYRKHEIFFGVSNSTNIRKERNTYELVLDILLRIGMDVGSGHSLSPCGGDIIGTREFRLTTWKKEVEELYEQMMKHILFLFLVILYVHMHIDPLDIGVHRKFVRMWPYCYFIVFFDFMFNYAINGVVAKDWSQECSVAI